MPNCPQCNSRVPDYARVCGMCGHRLRDAAAEAAAPAEKSPAEPIEEPRQPESEVQASPQPSRKFDGKIYAGMLVTAAVGVSLYSFLPYDLIWRIQTSIAKLQLQLHLGDGPFLGWAVIAALLGLTIGVLHWLIWRKTTGIPAAWVLLVTAAFFIDGSGLIGYLIGGFGLWVMQPLILSILLSLGIRKKVKRLWIPVLISTVVSGGFSYVLLSIEHDLYRQSGFSLPTVMNAGLTNYIAFISAGVVMPIFFARRRAE